jgi:hypothetical protein
MDENTRAVLTMPFPSDAIRSRRGHNGSNLRYIETWRVVERLNEAFAHGWSFKILLHQILEDEVLVLAELSVDGITKQAFGCSSITRAREGNTAISVGDDLKSAAADALKKAASLLGVGLEIFSGQASSDAPSTPRRRTGVVQGQGRTRGEASPPSGPDKTADRITLDQIRKVRELAEQVSLDERSFLNRIQKTYGVPLADLDAQQARDLISKLERAAHPGTSPAPAQQVAETR